MGSGMAVTRCDEGDAVRGGLRPRPGPREGGGSVSRPFYHDEECKASRKGPRWADADCTCQSKQHTNAGGHPMSADEKPVPDLPEGYSVTMHKGGEWKGG